MPDKQIICLANSRKLTGRCIAGIEVVDGVAGGDDLAFFAKEICNVDYVHRPILAPTQEMLDDYKKHGGDWTEYEKRFLGLMEARKIEDRLSQDEISGGCLLCSEDKPHHCHRRLVAEYLNHKWGNVSVRHLV